MSILLDMAAPPQTSGEWLGRAGWRAGSAGKWRHEPIPIKGDKKGRPLLVCRHDSSQWEAWDLVRGAIVPPAKVIDRGEGILAANADLPGPGKYVAADFQPADEYGGVDANVSCRFDLPRHLLGHQGDGDLADVEHPAEAWVRDVTALAIRVPSSDPSPASHAAPSSKLNTVHARLDKAGWPTTSVDGRLRVSLSLPGLFRQILIDLDGVHGPHVWCELIDLNGVMAESRQAAVHFALAANARLRLARVALVGQAPGLRATSAEAGTQVGSVLHRLVAEVVLGSARVPGAWLDVALECVHAAVVLCARELSALRDQELAKWYLSANGL